ncbi:MAG: transglycosylase SLT domain-containing protein [Gemmatimonadaceae bacterium]|nr:transglycosylase SLT domain-containing protein [Gemmatimonadaceae bacterium]
MRGVLVFLLALAFVVVAVTSARGASIPPKLAKEARYVASHGGVLSTRHGDATPRMRQLVRRLVVARFAPSGVAAVQTALCVVAGESGFNPGAISRGGDYGTFQINRASWEHVYDWGRILDPVYNIGVGWAMSERGFSWSPWTVWTNGSCR